jgi:hypothetical protein
LTFFSKSTTPLKYSKKIELLKNHDAIILAKKKQSQWKIRNLEENIDFLTFILHHEATFLFSPAALQV